MATTSSSSSSSSPSNLSFFTRLALAFSVFFRVLGNAVFAKRVQALPSGDAEAPQAQAQPAAKLHAAPAESALQLLGLFQREGRLMDFLMEDIAGYADAEIGAAARVVHDQCRSVLVAHVRVERIRTEAEGAPVTLPAGFSANEVRLVGEVAGQAPFRGVLKHAGWRAIGVELPQLSDGHDVRVIAPAEVEL
jgi:hypothetical protein